MKAHFALMLAFDGITLLARGHTGLWHDIGCAKLESPDVASDLKALRDKAVALYGDDFTSLIVLPEGQILYQTAPLNGMTERSAAAASLDGATPYDFKDLAFDTHPADAQGQSVQVAAVALETLMEAEQFAKEHGFRPIAFTALPDPRAFGGALHLGQTTCADSFLAGRSFHAEEHPLVLSQAPLKRGAWVLGTAQSAAQGATPAANEAPVPLVPRNETPPIPVAPPQRRAKKAAPMPMALWLSGLLLIGLAGIGYTTYAPELSEPAQSPPLSEAPAAEAPPVQPLKNAEVIPLDQSTALAEARVDLLDDAQANETTSPYVGLVPEEALDVFETTGLWTATTPTLLPIVEDSFEALYVTTLDSDIPPRDAVSLPLRTSFETDVRFVPEAARPTPEPVNTAEPSAPSTDDAEPLQVQALSFIRPTLRPDNAADLIERARNNGLTQRELANIKPKQRPESLVTRLAAERTDAQEAAKAAAAASLATVSDNPIESKSAKPSDLGERVAAIRPSERPRNMQQIIAQARDAQKASPASTRVASSRAARAPSIPSNASVSRAATQENKLSLRGVQLLGTFGKANNRGALVRLKSGRTARVKVGQRLDGGRVTAIGEGQVLYKKGSRNLKLEMPKL